MASATIREAVLTVAAIGADTDTLRCRLGARPSLGVFTLAFAPSPAAIVLEMPPDGVAAPGRLAVRDVGMTTCMGRTVRYLIPVFTTP